MIYRLQRRLILICTGSLLTVVALVFCVILCLNLFSLNRNMDALADRVVEGGGRFPGVHDQMPPPDGNRPPKREPEGGFMSPETPFSTRHFTVLFDANGAVEQTHTESIYAISDGEAIELAQRVLTAKKSRGWLQNYRYRVFEREDGSGVVFVDGGMSRASMIQSMTIAGGVLLCSCALVLLLIVLLSKRAVKPIAESYEKQKQFVTDAGHELKTPLTLILTNLDIAEDELGRNEWLEDIRAEGHRLRELVEQLVSLSRMDEAASPLNLSEVALGELVSNSVCEFRQLATERQKLLHATVDQSLTYIGDEELLSRLVGILLDNAVKYCDAGGEITVKLYRGRRVVLTVENSYSAVEEIELPRLFDRFYRADQSRRFNGGFGIGLSIARSIVEKHRGEITAYRVNKTHIGFRVVL